MSPQSLTDDELVDQLADNLAATPRDAAAAVAAPVETAEETRLTVRELQLAIAAARSLAGRGSRPITPPASAVVGEGGADRSRAALCPDALEGNPPVTPPIVAPASPPGSPPPPDPAATNRPEPWLPAHDGPVSLAGAAAPRTRTVRRATATPDKAARRPTKQRSTSSAAQTANLDPALAAAAVAAPPRLIVVAACGGAGATTATVLLAAALAQATGALLVASGADRGSLSVRANSSGGDVAALTAWASAHPGQALQTTTPGLACGNAGTEQLVLAAAGRDDPGQPFDADTAAALLTAAASTRGAVLLDWSSPTRPPQLVWSSVTHVLVVAPATSPGLLDAEYVVQNLEASRPAHTPLSVLTVDVRGRAPRRTGRAALARLQALHLPVTALPYDPALANDPRVHWAALRRRTRTAVIAALTPLLHADPPTDQYRKDES
jgi:hypothetical protein